MTDAKAVPKWQDEFKLKANLVQKDIYAFEKITANMGGVFQKGASIMADHALKAAIDAGWVEYPETEKGDFEGSKRYLFGGTNIDEMHPGKVRWYGARVYEVYAEAVEPPPN